MKIIKNIALFSFANQIILKLRIIVIRKAGVLTILNLHRVSEKDGSAYQSLTPAIFNELLLFIKKNFELTTFENLNSLAVSGKPKLILSFDDGYKDFIEYAVPILEKHHISVNQNIIPECVERKCPPINVIAQDFIGRAPSSLLKQLKISGTDIRFFNSNRYQMGLHVSSFIKNRPMSEQRELEEELMPQFLNMDNFVPTAMMSLEEVRQLIGVHELGAHSYSHASMRFESDEYFQRDMVNCRDYFLNFIKNPVDIYAFPNGSFREPQINMAKDFGYKHILLVNNSFSNYQTDVHNRFGFYANSKREGFFRAVGGFKYPYANNLKHVI
ncbi:MAG: polysaccharide deacetylase family protein [Nitrospirae bacterium]|nr:polysaccharide deacetylase family protein [Nitrospirota bacterium]